MKGIVFALALIASVASRSNPIEDFLTQVKQKTEEINTKSCQKVSSYKRKECLAYSEEMSSKLITDFRPIVEKELAKLKTNADGNYYQQDPTTKLWYLFKDGSKKTVQDGVQENTKILTEVLDFRYKELVNSQSGSSLQKRTWGSLKFRWFKSLSSSSRKPLVSSFDTSITSASSASRGAVFNVADAQSTTSMMPLRSYFKHPSSSDITVPTGNTLDLVQERNTHKLFLDDSVHSFDSTVRAGNQFPLLQQRRRAHFGDDSVHTPSRGSSASYDGSFNSEGSPHDQWFRFRSFDGKTTAVLPREHNAGLSLAGSSQNSASRSVGSGGIRHDLDIELNRMGSVSDTSEASQVLRNIENGNSKIPESLSGSSSTRPSGSTAQSTIKFKRMDSDEISDVTFDSSRSVSSSGSSSSGSSAQARRSDHSEGSSITSFRTPVRQEPVVGSGGIRHDLDIDLNRMESISDTSEASQVLRNIEKGNSKSRSGSNSGSSARSSGSSARSSGSTDLGTIEFKRMDSDEISDVTFDSSRSVSSSGSSSSGSSAKARRSDHSEGSSITSFRIPVRQEPVNVNSRTASKQAGSNLDSRSALRTNSRRRAWTTAFDRALYAASIIAPLSALILAITMVVLQFPQKPL